MSNLTASEVIDTMCARFTSGNSIPVERAHIKREEWAAIMAHIAHETPGPDQVADQLFREVVAESVPSVPPSGAKELHTYLLDHDDQLEARIRELVELRALKTELLPVLRDLRRNHSMMYPHHEDLCALCKRADAAIGKCGA